MPSRAPLHPLTSLRFFAAIGVVFYHTYSTFLPSKPFPAFVDASIAVGFLGVSCFFVLSGFILAYNYLEPPGAGSSGAIRTGRRSFLIARFARIYPLYLLGLLIHAPFIVAYRFAHDSSPIIALGKVIVSFGVNAGLAQGWLVALKAGWNPPGWSLSVEAFFYLVFPFVAPIVWRSRRSDLTLLLLLFATGLVAPAIATVFADRGWIRPEDLALEMIPLFRLPEFLFGIVLARWYFRSADRVSQLPSPGTLLGAGALLLAIAILEQGRIPVLILQIGVMMPAFALIIVGLARGDGALHRLLSRKGLVLLGEASYGIYILHVPLIFWVCYFAQRDLRLDAIPTPFAADAPITYAVYLAVLIGLSILSLRWFEEPARRWIRRLDRRREVIPPASVNELVQEAP
jgi:peptidoglycan/LPS O-acetylase OafA/YrhL